MPSTLCKVTLQQTTDGIKISAQSDLLEKYFSGLGRSVSEELFGRRLYERMNDSRYGAMFRQDRTNAHLFNDNGKPNLTYFRAVGLKNEVLFTLPIVTSRFELKRYGRSMMRYASSFISEKCSKSVTARMTEIPQRSQPVSQIDLVGVELEGGWQYSPEGETLGCDGSVSGVTGRAGELPSKPLKLNDLLRWMDKCYPHDINSSCGMHIHVSLDRLGYMKLMSTRFYHFFLERINVWGREHHVNPDSQFWKRLKGENTYCKKGLRPEYQAKQTGKNGDARYYHLNFCYGVHKTLECRLFPMFQKKELALSAVETFVNICNEYLRKERSGTAYLIEFVEAA